MNIEVGKKYINLVTGEIAEVLKTNLMDCGASYVALVYERQYSFKLDYALTKVFFDTFTEANWSDLNQYDKVLVVSNKGIEQALYFDTNVVDGQVIHTVATKDGMLQVDNLTKFDVAIFATIEYRLANEIPF